MVVPAQPVHHVELLAIVESWLDAAPCADVGDDAAIGVFLTAYVYIPCRRGKRKEGEQEEKHRHHHVAKIDIILLRTKNIQLFHVL